MSLKIRVSWAIMSLAAVIFVVPTIIYDTTRPSSLCTGFNIANPLTGICFGSYLTVAITFEHESIGIGFIGASLLMTKNRALMITFLSIGIILFILDAADVVNNLPGQLASAALGFLFAFGFYEMVSPDTLGTVEVHI